MKIDVTRELGISIFRPSGRMTSYKTEEFRNAVFENVRELPEIERPPKLLFDFSDVRMMDSTGPGALMEIGITIKQQGGRIGVINVGSHIKNLFVVSHLISHFEHFDTENEVTFGLREST